jgi:Tol biopolymer transport system component
MTPRPPFALIAGLALVVAALACNGEAASPTPTTASATAALIPGQPTDNWAAIRAADVAQVAEGWGTPVRLEASDGGWEDSLFVMPDGSAVLFMYYPGEDLLSDVLKGGPFADDIDIYFSNSPFTTKELDTRYYFSEDLWSAAGPMIAENGDAYYHANRQGGEDNSFDDDIYRNKELLPFNVNEKNERNPHYCAAQDELWFDENDQDIYVLKNAAAGNFTGAPQLAPPPLNAEGQDFQPWLSADCQTLYFTSGRSGFTAIYMTQRLDDETWSEPEIVIRSNAAVGEASLTTDGQRLFFIQLFADGQGHFTTDMFYTERHR